MDPSALRSQIYSQQGMAPSTLASGQSYYTLEVSMDPSALRSQIYSQQGMAPSTLASGQSYYTLESLEGASSLPFLKPAPLGSVPRRESLPASLPPPFERLDAQAKALVADRELLDARGRLLAAEREALLRNVSGGATALQDQRIYADGLQATDARARLSFDRLQNADFRGRALLENRALSHGFDAHPGISSLPDHRSLSHGLDMRARESLQPGVGNIPRALPVVGGFAQGATQNSSLSELLRARELGVGNPFAPVADPTLAWRDIANRRAEVPNVGAQNVHLLANGSRESPTMRFGVAEANKFKSQAERNKGISIPQQASFAKPQQASSAKPPAPKIKLPPEQSEGWCAVCKIDCLNIKTLGIHVNGRKHRAAVQGKSAKGDVASTAPSTSQAVKKRTSDEKPDMSQIAKRLKASSYTAPSLVAATEAKKAKIDAQKGKPTPLVAAAEAKKVKVDAQKVKPAATSISKPPATSISNPPELVCKICNITTTGKSNLESHMKGKRHAARVKELADPQLVSAN